MPRQTSNPAITARALGVEPAFPDETNPDQTAYRFEVAAYEHRALKAIHDAMHQQLAAGESAAAAATAERLLDRLQKSWISTALTEYEESFRDDDLQPDKAMLETLRLIARMCDGAFGHELRPEAMGIDHDETRQALAAVAARLSR